MCSLQHNNLCLLLVSQVSQRFYKLISVHSHVPEVLNWLSFLPALFFCSCFRLLTLLLFLQFLFICLLHTWYYPSFCYIIKNQFHLHSEVFFASTTHVTVTGAGTKLHKFPIWLFIQLAMFIIGFSFNSFLVCWQIWDIHLL